MKKTDYSEEEKREIGEIARQLNEYPTKYFTCHCTGMKAYEIMKSVMGDKLIYVHSGDVIPTDCI